MCASYIQLSGCDNIYEEFYFAKIPPCLSFTQVSVKPFYSIDTWKSILSSLINESTCVLVFKSTLFCMHWSVYTGMIYNNIIHVYIDEGDFTYIVGCPVRAVYMLILIVYHFLPPANRGPAPRAQASQGARSFVFWQPIWLHDAPPRTGRCHGRQWGWKTSRLVALFWTENFEGFSFCG